MQRLAVERKRGDKPEFDLVHKMIVQHQIPSDINAIAMPETKLAYTSLFKDIEADQPKTSRLAVFQQAFIRSWIVVSRDLIKHGVLPGEAAHMVVAAFEKTIVPHDMQFLGSSTFTQHMLWQGERANFKGGEIKQGWLNLMLSSLSMKVAIDASINALEKLRGTKLESPLKQSLTTALRSIARQAASAYLSTLRDQLIKFYKNNYMEVIQDEAEIEHLRALQKSGNADDKKKFLEEIAKISSIRFEEAKSKLLAYISVQLEDLLD